jgi:hypothetical protein
MVNRGGFVVKVWLETAANSALKNMPTFRNISVDFFWRYGGNVFGKS